MKVYHWLEAIQFYLLPPRCLLCGGPGRQPLDLCLTCEAELPWIEHPCPVCARPLPAAAPACGACLRRPPPFERTIALWHYQPPVDRLVTAAKYRGLQPPLRLFGECLARRLDSAPRPDCLVPVPLHPRRLRQRGFNQSLEIARVVGRRLGIPLRPGLCRRIRFTPPQQGLSARDRRRNLRGAFVADPAVRGRHVALIDDVMTTAATVAEIATTLRRAGVTEVSVWVIARA
ncbi:hypothetical protein MIT9_P1996 [Methylomarinovum caldicuralii]|uniref:Double zinc ribbon domain-containing protein n=1 Tax=Methylomarinovum caldicuralii TaxID=438856 RepID=A0AAU9C593_9GAMM|nr:ComF family protein [Methylomarinovum caldicuralii]BCX82410.1 hypothetical protein MIT9_P1996 [Methylomarinovum caldicuralii]